VFTTPSVMQIHGLLEVIKQCRLILVIALVEVDLETLEKVSHERFPSSITALSEVKYPTPVTVGTNLSLYLHDSRSRARGVGSGEVELFDSYDAQPQPLRIHGSLDFRRLLNPGTTSDCTSSAYLYQPGPSSILHTSDGDWNGSGDIHQIYVCGRFPRQVQAHIFHSICLFNGSGDPLLFLGGYIANSMKYP
jgi:hypothetical protein